MQKRPFLLIFFLFFLVNTAYAVKIDSSVEERLTEQSSVSVIVILEDNDQPRIKSLNNEISSFKQRKSKIKEQQKRVLGSLKVKHRLDNKKVRAVSSNENIDFALKHKYSTINSFSGEITKQGLEKLKKNPNVKSIHVNRVMHVFLDVSVPLVNATKTWGYIYNGTNMTGKGETVCVIDTGVEYTHPNLGGCFGAGCKVIGGYDYVNNDNYPMDDNGHGTHVAGTIVSNHSTYRGIAPDANIVAIKVLNSSGEGYSNDIIAGIDWCVAKAQTYNISVISMSLGTVVLFDSYCDINDPAFKTSIDTAVLNNIAVTVATGNDGSSTEISSPACIQNATAIGATDDNDNIASFSNRNSLTDLLAPGENIYSTYPTNTFFEANGTSMSAPHAAGAFVLLYQFYKKLFAQTPTPSLLEDALNDTGKDITDGANTYQRINIYAALLSLDNVSLVLNITSPSNNSKVRDTWIVINVTSNKVLSSALLEWNTTTNYTMNGSSLSFYYNISTFTNTSYTFRVFGNDNAGNQGVTNVFTIEMNNSAPNIISYYPSNLTQNISEPDNQKFNISFSDAENDLVNITWYQNGSLVLSGINQTEWNFTGNYSASGDYNITVIIDDGVIGDGITTVSNSWILKVNNTNFAPNITLNLPFNDSYLNRTWNLFNWTVTDNDDTINCYLYLYADNNTNPISLLNITSGSIITYNWTNLNETTYYWKLQCDDTYINSSNTTIRQFTIDTTPPTTYPDLSASNVSDYDNDGNIELNWTDDSTESNETYRLYRHIARINSSNINENMLIASNIKQGTQFYEDNTSLHNTAYWYALVTVDRVGKYNISVLSDSYNATANDTIIPKSPTNLNATQSGNTATIQWKNITKDVNGNADFFNARYIVYTSTSINTSKNPINISVFTKVANITTNSTTYSIGASEIRYFVVVSADDAGNENLSLNTASEGNYVNISLTYTPPSTPSGGGGSSGGGGGGGGGGAAAPSKGTSTSRMWSEAEGETLMPVRNTEIAVSELKIDIINPSENVELTVTKLDKKPNVASISGTVYQYIEINKKNIENKDISKAEIKFKVEQSWLKEDNTLAEDIALNRYTTKWEELPTVLIKEDRTYAHYKATTGGFSYFAISAKAKEKKKIAEKITNKAKETNQSINQSAEDYFAMPITGAVTVSQLITSGERKANLNRLILLILAVILVIILFPLRNWLYSRKRKHNKP